MTMYSSRRQFIKLGMFFGISVMIGRLPDAMPPFAHRLNAAEVADLVTWIRAEWGGQAVPVTVEQVSAQETAVK